MFRSAILVRHCDVIRLPIFMIFVSMERRPPTLYYVTKQLYFGRVTKKAREDEGQRFCDADSDYKAFNGHAKDLVTRN